MIFTFFDMYWLTDPGWPWPGAALDKQLILGAVLKGLAYEQPGPYPALNPGANVGAYLMAMRN